MCLWKMGSGPKTTWRDGITQSRKSLGRVTSRFFEKVEVFKLQLKVSLRQLMAGGALRSVLLHKQRTKDKELKKKFDNGDHTLAKCLSFWEGSLFSTPIKLSMLTSIIGTVDKKSLAKWEETK